MLNYTKRDDIFIEKGEKMTTKLQTATKRLSSVQFQQIMITFCEKMHASVMALPFLEFRISKKQRKEPQNLS